MNVMKEDAPKNLNKNNMTKEIYVAGNKTEYLNVLRVYACMAVIIFHIFAIIISAFGTTFSEIEKYICVLLRNIWLWHVPTFIMISGVIFLNKEKEITIKKLYLKYISRIVLALIIFGFPFAFMEIFYDNHYQFNIGQLGTSLLNVFQGNLWDHMWYLYMITGLYILLPFFKIFANYSDRKTLEYVLIVLFVFTGVIPTFASIFRLNFGISIPLSSVFALYLLLGHYIHRYNVIINNKILYLTGLLYILYMAFVAINKDFVDARGDIVGLNGNISPLVVWLTVCVFCYVRQHVPTNKVYDLISPLTFGMYLIHPLIINLFIKVIKFTPDKYPLVVVVVVVAIVTTILSLLFTLVARKIKIVKKYIL